jgi:hypothetical protein
MSASDALIPSATALPDYPAAHSMDTEWFAVDREGNVAMFDTGECGQVPVGAVTLDQDAATRLTDLVLPARPVAPVIFDPTFLLAANTADHVGRGEHVHDSPLVVFLGVPPTTHLPLTVSLAEQPRDRSPALGSGSPPPSSNGGLEPMLPLVRDMASLGRLLACGDARTLAALSALQDALRDGRARPLPSAVGVCFLLGPGTQELRSLLHQSNACSACDDDDPDDEIEGRETRLSGHGIYVYLSEFDYGRTAGLYLRHRLPAVPLKLSELPADLQAAIGAVRFDRLSFAESPAVQPMETHECNTWGEMTAYRTVDGREVPLRTDPLG